MRKMVSVNNLLTAYWIEFEGWGLASQFGVTAYSLDDAQFLLKQLWFNKTEMPVIKAVTENIQFKDLDQNDVAPYIGPITERGIWFPYLRLA